MVNWHDPVLEMRDYFDLTKLIHAVAGLYIWETVFSAGFELNVLRGKQPYRWTIWLYLGTRYSSLLMFIFFFLHDDGGDVPCKPLMLLSCGFAMVGWACASLIIVLRIVAIWDRNRLVSAISFSAWSTGFGLNIATLWTLGAVYDPAFDVCFVTNIHRSLAASFSIPLADAILFLLMLVGLLLRAHGNNVGIWRVLYNQCIIWMTVAAIVEVPPLVFLILNLNDAWNSMFPEVAVAILSICAARMYRALCEQGSFTEYAPSDPPYSDGGLPFPNSHHRRSVHSPLHFRTGAAGTTTRTLSDRMMAVEPFVFVEAEEVRQADYEYVPPPANASNSTLNVPAKTVTRSRDVAPPVYAGHRLSWHPPVDASLRFYE